MNHRLWKCVFGFVTEVDTGQGGQTCLRRPGGPFSDFADLRVSTICDRFGKIHFRYETQSKSYFEKNSKNEFSQARMLAILKDIWGGSLQWPWNQRTTKGQNRLGTFPHFFGTFQNFSSRT